MQAECSARAPDDSPLAGYTVLHILARQRPGGDREGHRRLWAILAQKCRGVLNQRRPLKYKFGAYVSSAGQASGLGLAAVHDASSTGNAAALESLLLAGAGGAPCHAVSFVMQACSKVCASRFVSVSLLFTASF